MIAHFIKLTKKLDGKCVVININNIAIIEDGLVRTMQGDNIQVREDLQEIYLRYRNTLYEQDKQFAEEAIP